MEIRKVLDIEVDDFTHNDLLAFKEAYSLTNEDLANIIGTSLQNVKNTTGKSKKVPTWGRALLFMWKINNQNKL